MRVQPRRAEDRGQHMIKGTVALSTFSPCSAPRREDANISAELESGYDTHEIGNNMPLLSMRGKQTPSKPVLTVLERPFPP